jgi:hypothetical protein
MRSPGSGSTHPGSGPAHGPMLWIASNVCWPAHRAETASRREEADDLVSRDPPESLAGFSRSGPDAPDHHLFGTRRADRPALHGSGDPSTVTQSALQPMPTLGAPGPASPGRPQGFGHAGCRLVRSRRSGRPDHPMVRGRRAMLWTSMAQEARPEAYGRASERLRNLRTSGTKLRRMWVRFPAGNHSSR